MNANEEVGPALARIRGELGITQSAVASQAKLDQSRVSRLEKGETGQEEEVERVLGALEALGSNDARLFAEFRKMDWLFVEPPSFWNPQRACLETAEETLAQLDDFLSDEAHPWPLRRQMERHRDSMLKASSFLTRTNHSVAFIGDIGVGKSTAISFLFDLLIPASPSDKKINRPVLETGAGGTTICEVHIKSGPEFGLSIVPMSESDLRGLISDFGASKWMLFQKANDPTDPVGVSPEAERAIRNMAGLNRKRETVNGKIVYHDPINELASSSSNEQEFTARILAACALAERGRRELWYESGTRKHPMEWLAETFRAVNNGRLKDVSLPASIDLIIPQFSRSYGEFELSVIDTKGVDDVAVRQDLDLRLKDPRTTIVFASRFNDAPGTGTRILLQHMQKTFSESLDTGKVSVLCLPRSEEARAMKDDSGERALTDEEGYQFKEAQVASQMSSENLGGVPIAFYNVESDSAEEIRAALLSQIGRMRHSVEERLFDLCAAAQDIMKNHEAQALHAALQEVADRLRTFLAGNRKIGARESLAYAEALETVGGVRYASTLWASARRNGEYYGLNLLHLLGVGSARDARLRTVRWFASFEDFLKALRADPGLSLAARSIDQMAATAVASQRAFLDAAQSAGNEVYRGPLAAAAVWSDCVGEWGQGPGFKYRVAEHLESWFEDRADLKEHLEEALEGLWDQTVILPLRQLAEENVPELAAAA